MNSRLSSRRAVFPLLNAHRQRAELFATTSSRIVGSPTLRLFAAVQPRPSVLAYRSRRGSDLDGLGRPDRSTREGTHDVRDNRRRHGSLCTLRPGDPG